MSDWTAGYVADIGYTYGYYFELNPLRVKLAFLNAGLACPTFGTACELGFGQGVGTNLHAAASVTQWSGTDFNPAQAGFAQEMAAAAGSGAQLFDQAFDEFSARADLPDFDFIGLHGIWSWISDANRAVIVDFLRRKLKVGGVLYISYNTQPGWAAMVPMRDLLTEYSEVMGSVGEGIVSRIDGAMAFAERFMASDPIYARAYPAMVDNLKKIKGQNRNYVAHEYFNRDWKPMSFTDMRRWLEPAKLSYAASAKYLDAIDALNLQPQQQALINDIPDTMLRQTVRDFVTNQTFRKDYWVRGGRPLSLLERTEGFRAQKVVLASHRPDVLLTVSAGIGEATMSAAIYNPLLDALADHAPKTLGELEQLLKDKDVGLPQLIQAILVLAGIGHVYAVQDDDAIAQAKPSADRLNAFLIDQSRGREDIGYLASPVIGGGLPVNRVAQLFVLALLQGQREPAQWAQLAGDILLSQGQAVMKEGKALQTAEENIAELAAQAEKFAVKQLPILRALQIV